MGNKQTTSSSPVIGAPGRTPSAGPARPAAGQPAQLRVMCPSCHTLLVPPASLFRCPCGQIMTYQLPASSAAGAAAGGAGAPRTVPAGGPVVPPRGGSTILFSSTGRAGSLAAAPPDVQMQLMSASVEERIRFLLAHLPPDSPHAAIFRTLLERMPRRADGVTIDFAALEVLSHTLVANSGLAGGGGGGGGYGASAGASPEMLELLPTRTFKAKPPPAAAADQTAAPASDSTAAAGGAGASSPSAGSGRGSGSASADDEGEDRSCKICQCEYEDGEELVTLPCLHFFHASCAKEWLKRKRICALCRMPIDIDMDAALAEALAKEEEELAAAADKADKKGSGAAGGADGGAASAPGSVAAASRQPSGRATASGGQSEAGSAGGFFARWRRGSR